VTQVTLDLPESAFATFHQAPKEFAQEMRVAAAVKWYELGRLSQGRAAEIAGLTRAVSLMPSRATESAHSNTRPRRSARNCAMRIDAVVINASPLITLFRSGQGALLPGLFKQIVVPEAVWRKWSCRGRETVPRES
jgi:hypothetical protein